jgi:glycerol-3-phosphate dehydrogenase subunit B
MEIGVKTDDQLRCMKNGEIITNLYATGAILSGHNSIKSLDAAGVDMLTALQAVNNILK